jgi:tetratricopeptide (TPR) repeat protein
MDTLAISGLINIGGVLRGSGDYESAGKYYSRALNIARDGKIKRYEALASLSLAALFELKNQPEESRRFAEAAKPFYSRAGYRKEFAQVMTILGSALHRLGEFDQGIKTLREALPRAVQIQDLRLELQIRDRLIETLRDKGAWPEALQESEQAAILPMTGIPITFAHLNCAGMYWRLGRWQDAERSLSTAEQIMQKKDDPEAMSFLRFHQAEIAYVEGRFEKATAFARMAISAVPATGDEIEPHAKLIEALSLIRTGRRSEGIQSARQLIQEFDQSKSIVNAASARLMVAEALSGVNERSVARGMALDALGFSEPHMIWESVLRGHLVAARVSDSPAEAEKHRAAAGAALAQLRNLWPAGSVEGYLGRADIKLLCSRLRL